MPKLSSRLSAILLLFACCCSPKPETYFDLRMLGTPSYSGGLIINEKQSVSLLLDFGGVLDLDTDRWRRAFADGSLVSEIRKKPITSIRLFDFNKLLVKSATDFSAFGAVIFPSRAVDHKDLLRHQKVCESYLSAIPTQKSLKNEFENSTARMITVWPISYKMTLTENDLQDFETNNICQTAVKLYDLEYSLYLLKIARRVGFDPNDRGPYLIAWSPGHKLEQPDAHILIADMSYFDEAADMTNVFRRWRFDIESNPEHWADTSPSSLEKFRLSLRRWADDFGPRVLSLLGGV